MFCEPAIAKRIDQDKQFQDFQNSTDEDLGANDADVEWGPGEKTRKRRNAGRQLAPPSSHTFTFLLM